MNFTAAIFDFPFSFSAFLTGGFTKRYAQ